MVCADLRASGELISSSVVEAYCCGRYLLLRLMFAFMLGWRQEPSQEPVCACFPQSPAPHVPLGAYGPLQPRSPLSHGRRVSVVMSGGVVAGQSARSDSLTLTHYHGVFNRACHTHTEYMSDVLQCVLLRLLRPAGLRGAELLMRESGSRGKESAISSLLTRRQLAVTHVTLYSNVCCCDCQLPCTATSEGCQ